jgi:transcriptional regulator with XRE-family HTH domain
LLSVNIVNSIVSVNHMVYNVFSVNWRCRITTSDMIKQLCEHMNISVAELARRIGQTPQNFNKKLKRETVTLDELKAIADVMNVKFEQTFILPDGKEIKTGNE